MQGILQIFIYENILSSVGFFVDTKFVICYPCSFFCGHKIVNHGTVTFIVVGFFVDTKFVMHNNKDLIYINLISLKGEELFLNFELLS